MRRHRMTDEELDAAAASLDRISEDTPSRRASAGRASARESAPETPRAVPAKSGGFKKFLAWVGAIGTGVALWFGGQKQGETKAYKDAAQPQGLQLVLKQQQQPATVQQAVQASYENSVMKNIAKGNIKKAVEDARDHGNLKTVVAGHSMGLPEKEATIISKRMDTEIACEDANQAAAAAWKADANARKARSENQVGWEHIVGPAQTTEDALKAGTRVVHEAVGFVDGLIAGFNHLVGRD